MKWLRIPVYKLYYLDFVEGFEGLDETELSKFDTAYSLEERRNIIEALRWAAKNPTYDFNELLPGLEWPNEGIYKYFLVLLEQFTERYHLSPETVLL